MKWIDIMITGIENKHESVDLPTINHYLQQHYNCKFRKNEQLKISSSYSINWKMYFINSNILARRENPIKIQSLSDPFSNSRLLNDSTEDWFYRFFHIDTRDISIVKGYPNLGKTWIPTAGMHYGIRVVIEQRAQTQNPQPNTNNTTPQIIVWIRRAVVSDVQRFYSPLSFILISLQLQVLRTNISTDIVPSHLELTTLKSHTKSYVTAETPIFICIQRGIRSITTRKNIIEIVSSTCTNSLLSNPSITGIPHRLVTLLPSLHWKITRIAKLEGIL